MLSGPEIDLLIAQERLKVVEHKLALSTEYVEALEGHRLATIRARRTPLPETQDAERDADMLVRRVCVYYDREVRGLERLLG